MSLFENDQFRWRETYFVLFDQENRPPGEDVANVLKELGSRYEINNVLSDDEGRFESLTLLSPYDYAAMDISYIAGEEVIEQVNELRTEMKNVTLTADEMQKVSRLKDCNARFDIYHFEQVVDDEDEFLDPGGLLIVLESLAEMTNGIGIDPQSGSVV